MYWLSRDTSELQENTKSIWRALCSLLAQQQSLRPTVAVVAYKLGQCHRRPVEMATLHTMGAIFHHVTEIMAAMQGILGA